jgi:hypothetical protein
MITCFDQLVAEYSSLMENISFTIKDVSIESFYGTYQNSSAVIISLPKIFYFTVILPPIVVPEIKLVN